MIEEATPRAARDPAQNETGGPVRNRRYRCDVDVCRAPGPEPRAPASSPS